METNKLIKGTGIITKNPEWVKQAGHVNILFDANFAILCITYRDQCEVIKIPKLEWQLVNESSIFCQMLDEKQIKKMRALSLIHHSRIIAFQDKCVPPRWLLRDGSVLHDNVTTPINHVISDESWIEELEVLKLAPLNIDEELDELNKIEGLRY